MGVSARFIQGALIAMVLSVILGLRFKTVSKAQSRSDEADSREALYRQNHLQKLYPADDSKSTDVDIIAVHGLGTSSPRTWTKYEDVSYGDKSQEQKVIWLNDSRLLPSVVPHANIWTFNYDSRWYDDAPSQRLLPLAEMLLRVVSDQRAKDGTSHRPLIFIASSFGGIVVAQAIERSSQLDGPPHDVFRSTAGIVFLGAPLRGTPYASATKWITLFGKLVGRESSNSLIKDLDGKTDVLTDLVDKFSILVNRADVRLPIRCFYEMRQTQLSGNILPTWLSRLTQKILVEEYSACIDGHPKQGLNLGHTMMNKFSSPDDGNYKLVASQVAELVHDAPRVLSNRKGQSEQPIFSVPFQRNNDFVQRENIFGELEKKLPVLGPGRSVALLGLGGSGKSQIALEYAYRRHARTLCSVIWIHAESASRFLQDFRNVAQLAGISLNQTQETLLMGVRRWLEQQHNLVLILDAVDDLSLFRSLGKQQQEDSPRMDEQDLLRYVPTGPLVTILWTSRDAKLLGSFISVDDGITVGPMEEEEATSLLRKLSGRNGPASSDSRLEGELVNILGHLPIAILPAAYFIRNTGLSTRGYLEMLRLEESLTRLLTTAFTDRFHAEDISSSVLNTWLVSVRQISREGELITKLLYSTVFLDGKGIPFELLKAIVSKDITDDSEILSAAGRLKDFGFLQVQVATTNCLPIYEISSIVQVALRHYLLSAEGQKGFNRTLLSSLAGLARIFPEQSESSDGLRSRYFPHAVSLLLFAPEDMGSEHQATLLKLASTHAQDMSNWGTALPYQKRLIALLRQGSGDEDSIASGEDTLAIILLQLGKIGEAENVLMRRLEEADFAYGKSPAFVENFEEGILKAYENFNAEYIWTTNRIDIGLIHRSEDGLTFELSESIAILEFFRLGLAINSPESLSLASGALPKSRQQPDGMSLRAIPLKRLKDVTTLARGYLQQRRLSAGLAIVTSVAKYQEEYLVAYDSDRTSNLLLKADFLIELHRLEQAEKILEELLGLCNLLMEATKETTERWVCRASPRISKIRRMQGRLSEAEAMQREIWADLSGFFGDDNVEALAAGAELARTLLQQNKIAEADEVYSEVLHLQEEVLGTRHPDYLSGLEFYTLVLLAQGNEAEAEEYLLYALETREGEQGALHPSTLRTLEMVAILYDRRDNLQDATTYAWEALQRRDKASRAIGEHSFSNECYSRVLEILVRSHYKQLGKLLDPFELASGLWGQRPARKGYMGWDTLTLELMEQMVYVYGDLYLFRDALSVASQRLQLIQQLGAISNCNIDAAPGLLERVYDARRKYFFKWIFYDFYVPWKYHVALLGVFVAVGLAVSDYFDSADKVEGHPHESSTGENGIPGSDDKDEE